MRIKMLLLLLSSLLCVPQFSLSEQQGSPDRQITVIGRKNITVSTHTVTLDDIAHITSKQVSDDDSVIALKKIHVVESGNPGDSLTVTASEVLERMREQGVDLHHLGYAFPRVMTVQRAARALTLFEIESVIKEAMPKDGDSELIKVIYDGSTKIAPGPVTLSAEIRPSNRGGRYTAKILAVVTGEEPIRLNIPLEVKEWIQVPVAKRPLPRGVVVSSADVVMARAELSELPIDAARDSEQILGYETKNPIGYGEVFRKRKLSIPPVIERGERITLLYKTPFLEATASGVAVEDGAQGERIRVRNENSKKTISGEVIHPGLVRVNP